MMSFLQGLLYIVKQTLAGRSDLARYVLEKRFRGIDTSFELPETLGLDPTSSRHHSDSGGPDLDIVLKKLDIHPSDSVLDIGSGKGGALITLCKYPFRLVDGVELSENLTAIAKSNLAKLGIQKCRLFCCNAVDFRGLNSYNYFYMYNPFGCDVMKAVLGRLAESLVENPRNIKLIYKNPVCHEQIVGAGILKKNEEYHHSTQPFYVYSNSIVQS